MWRVEVNIEGGREPKVSEHRTKAAAMRCAREAMVGVEYADGCDTTILVPARMIGRVFVRRLED